MSGRPCNQIRTSSTGTDLAQSDDARIARDCAGKAAIESDTGQRHRASPLRGPHRYVQRRDLGIPSKPRRSRGPRTTDHSERSPPRLSGSFLPFSLPPPNHPPPCTSQPPCFSHSRSRLSLRAPREEEKPGGWDVVVLEGSWREHEALDGLLEWLWRFLSRGGFPERSLREGSGGSCFQDGLLDGPENPTASEMATRARTGQSWDSVSWGSPGEASKARARSLCRVPP